MTRSLWFIPLYRFIPTYNIVYSLFVRQPTLSLVYSETEGEQSLVWPRDFSVEIYFKKRGVGGGRRKRQQRVGGGVVSGREKRRKKRPPFYMVEAAVKGVQICFITLISSS